ncbi:MAG: hypothetical protein OXU77_22710 [Gammaproteobacteria bacterium]|nr:hypothetical protein [Gammaproteobacteria bacterium]MDE0444752.1 hypothetical protein [Gammaproteobacteria bacterium]
MVADHEIHRLAPCWNPRRRTPGYRIYFGRDGETLIVLLGGGTKRRQQSDIETARRHWRDYRRRRQEE